MLEKLEPYIVEHPWAAIGIAFAAGAVMAIEFPGRGLVVRAVRLLAMRELKGLAKNVLLPA